MNNLKSRRRLSPVTHRLQGYDYSELGAYFVTIVTINRELLFSDDEIRAIVERTWRWLGERYDYVNLDEFVVMPNHLHGILWLGERPHYRTEPTGRATEHKSVGGLIGAFKTVSTREINVLRGRLGVSVWQPNFYDHIIRDDEDLNRIREYIFDNPRKWDEDPENPNVARLASRSEPTGANRAKS
jgi:putative transposase